MNHNDQALSRATSVSRASRQNSTVSRNQSLIKKNIAPHDLHPSDVLIERFVAWKAIVKQLIAYFEGIADIENNTAKELTRLGAVIQVPFRAGNQFLGEGGLQDVYFAIRNNSRAVADQHANLGRTIDTSIVQHLQKLRTEIKAHIKNVQNDTGKLATSVAKERELSTKLISDLSQHISLYKNRPLNISAKEDPYIANALVHHQLQKQVHEENLLQKSIIIMQQNSAHFEEGIVRAIQSAWQTYEEWSSRSSIAIQSSSAALAAQMSALAPDREWISFSARTDHLLDPDTPLRNPSTVNYPCKDDPSVFALHTGYLERKKRFTRTYRESYFVLTAAGFLHEYASNDPSSPEGLNPMFSLFLPLCTLGPPSTSVGPGSSHKFHIEGRKDGVGTTKGQSPFKALTGNAQHAWSFRARSREDMMEWWNDIRMLCARYLVASESMERSGPLEAAVRAAGYVSEDEGITEDEGSSVEEEEGEEGVDEEYEHAQEAVGEEREREYEKGKGVEIGPNGYAKPAHPENAPEPEQQLQPDSVPISSNPDDAEAAPDPTSMEHISARQAEKSRDLGDDEHAADADADAEAEGDDLSYVDAPPPPTHPAAEGPIDPDVVHAAAERIPTSATTVVGQGQGQTQGQATIAKGDSRFHEAL
ncbi:hypothetical protein H0H92_013976 [Tricholoma furcatifolium]|nr:hypothetical protein H0H92_013976 [Tricholoma furcatifolium]